MQTPKRKAASGWQGLNLGTFLLWCISRNHSYKMSEPSHFIAKVCNMCSPTLSLDLFTLVNKAWYWACQGIPCGTVDIRVAFTSCFLKLLSNPQTRRMIPLCPSLHNIWMQFISKGLPHPHCVRPFFCVEKLTHEQQFSSLEVLLWKQHEFFSQLWHVW